MAILRYQSSGGPPPQHYLLGILPGGASMNIYAIAAGGTATGLATAATVSLTAGHNYRLDARAWGVAPTNLALDLYDLTASSDIATLGPITDSTAGLQAAGQMGIVLNTSATSTSITLSEVSCSIAGTLVGPADQHLYVSPGSWSDGSGTMQPNNVLPGSTEVIMCQPGAYLKSALSSSTAIGQAWLIVNCRYQVGVAVGSSALIGGAVDYGVPLSVQTCPGVTTMGICLGSALSAASHSVWAWYQAADQTTTSSQGTRWGPPASLDFSGFRSAGPGDRFRLHDRGADRQLRPVALLRRQHARGLQ